MIITQRTIKDTRFQFPLIENEILDHDPAEPLPASFLRFGCKIADKHVRKGRSETVEGVFEWFNAPSRAEAFEHADKHIDGWVAALKVKANQPQKPKLSLPSRLNGKN